MFWDAFCQFSKISEKKMVEKMNPEESMPGTYVPDNFRVSKWLLETDLSLGAKLTYSVLASCSCGRDYVWPSQEYLAKAVSASVRTIQRYLKELVNFGLIGINRQFLMGQIRSVYSFLNHSLVSFSSRKAKTTTQISPAKPPKSAQNLTPKEAKKNDNFGISYIKEESNINNNIPPTPQTSLALDSAELVSAEAEIGLGGEGFNSDNPREEDKAWTDAVQILSQRLSEYDLNFWIKSDSTIFEKGEDSVGVLRLPNEFFRKQVEKRFGVEINQAFKKVGVSSVHFDLMTANQQEELQKKKLALEEARRNIETQASKAEKVRNKAKLANLDGLPLEVRFDLLYAAYPVQKEREKACKVFMQLAKNNQLPSMSELFESIKEHQAKDRWWREKMPPLLGNWLTNRKWQDKPYE